MTNVTRAELLDTASMRLAEVVLLLPPDLQPPWRTATRVELQTEARVFAQDIVLPIADELAPQKGEMPRNTVLSRRNSRALGFRSAASWPGAKD
jgi:hypothetical protein